MSCWRDKVLYIRLHAEEIEYIQKNAATAGMNTTEYARRVLMEHSVHSKGEERLRGEIARQGGLIKMLIERYDFDTDIRNEIRSVLAAQREAFRTITEMIKNDS